MDCKVATGFVGVMTDVIAAGVEGPNLLQVVKSMVV